MTDRYEIEMLWRCGACRAENKGRHKKCTSCGCAKTDDDAFYMPGDTSPAAAVTDPALLEKALAGPDWVCAFCRSAQGKLDGKCRNCGASAESGPSEDYVEERSGASFPVYERRRANVAVIVGLALAALVGLVGWLVFRTRVVDAHVASVAWTHKVVIDRWQVWHRQGFDQERGAFNVKDQGARIHHYNHVVDHYRTEAYTVQVACGETCRPIPRTCYSTPRVCTSSKNGFASCSGGGTVCSGGGQSCSTRYCTEPRTRQVPVYRDDPVYRDWYTWDVWDWGYNRTVAHEGTATATSWPSDAEIAKGALMHEGEKERSRREESYRVVLADHDDTWPYEPKSDAEFRGIAAGSVHRIKDGVGRGIELLPPR